MSNWKDKIELYAPFLSHYWLHLLCIIIAFLIAKFFSGFRSNLRAEKYGAHHIKGDEAIAQDSVESLDPDSYNEEANHIPYRQTNRMSATEMMKQAQDFYKFMNERRSVRFISKEPIPSLDLIKTIVLTAGTAPSGAHMQPWTFVVVSKAKVKFLAVWDVLSLLYVWDCCIIITFVQFKLN